MKDSKYTTHLFILFLQNLFSLESKALGALYIWEYCIFESTVSLRVLYLWEYFIFENTVPLRVLYLQQLQSQWNK